MLRRLALYLMCALALTIGIGSVTHAMEPVGCATEASETPLAHGDSGQSKDMDGKFAPHIHGACHGHHLSTTPDTMSPAPHIFIADLVPSTHIIGRITNAAAPVLRPPIA